MRGPGLTRKTLTGMTVGIDSRNDIPEGIATLGAFMGYSQFRISVLIAEDMAVWAVILWAAMPLGT
ncbi:hypothetical protein ACLB1E_25155 [Escherichia coli]